MKALIVAAVQLGLRLLLAGVACVALAAWLRLDHPLPDLRVQFTAGALAAALLGAAAALPLKRIPLGGGFVAAAAALALAAGPHWRPAPPAQGPSARVYMANLWVRNDDVERVRASIAEARADVVVLIELGDVQAAALERLLPDHPHRLLTRRVEWSSGAARLVIASRHPLRSQAVPADGVTAATVVAEIPGFGPLRVVGVHLTRPWPFQPPYAQPWQAERLRARLEAPGPPTVVVGDFNAVVGGRVLRRLTEDGGLQPAPSYPGTWPAPAPAPLRLGIDNALAGHGAVVTGRRLGRPTGSDHRPIIVEVAAPPRP